MFPPTAEVIIYIFFSKCLTSMVILERFRFCLSLQTLLAFLLLLFATAAAATTTSNSSSSVNTAAATFAVLLLFACIVTHWTGICYTDKIFTGHSAP